MGVEASVLDRAAAFAQDQFHRLEFVDIGGRLAAAEPKDAFGVIVAPPCLNGDLGFGELYGISPLSSSARSFETYRNSVFQCFPAE